jgi:DNA-binding phage protein
MDRKGVLYGFGDGRKQLSFGAQQQEEQPLVAALRVFVAASGLTIPRVARLMGVGDATLYKWLAGTARPTQKKLLEIESFLGWHGPKYMTNSLRSKAASA